MLFKQMHNGQREKKRKFDRSAPMLSVRLRKNISVLSKPNNIGTKNNELFTEMYTKFVLQTHDMFYD